MLNKLAEMMQDLESHLQEYAGEGQDKLLHSYQNMNEQLQRFLDRTVLDEVYVAEQFQVFSSVLQSKVAELMSAAEKSSEGLATGLSCTLLTSSSQPQAPSSSHEASIELITSPLTSDTDEENKLNSNRGRSALLQNTEAQKAAESLREALAARDSMQRQLNLLQERSLREQENVNTLKMELQAAQGENKGITDELEHLKTNSQQERERTSTIETALLKARAEKTDADTKIENLQVGMQSRVHFMSDNVTFATGCAYRWPSIL